MIYWMDWYHPVPSCGDLYTRGSRGLFLSLRTALLWKVLEAPAIAFLEAGAVIEAGDKRR